MAMGSIRRTLARGALGGILAVLFGGLGSVALAAGHTVDIAGFAFSPGTITVKVGDTITWTNSDSVSHTATADNGAFDTGTIGAGSSKSVTLAAAGTFTYHCKIHSAMTATVVVSAAGSGSGSGAPPATDTVPAADPPTDAAPIDLLGLAAGFGFVIGRRRFARAGS